MKENEIEPTTDCFNRGLQFAIDEITGWENLQVKYFEEISKDNGFTYPKEAKREHNNTMNLLAVIKQKIEKRKV